MENFRPNQQLNNGSQGTQDKTLENNEPNGPKYLSQIPAIQELTGPDEKSILEEARKRFMADWLLNYVCRYFKEDESDILSPRKFRNFVIVRGVYSYFMHRKLKYSLPQIGRRLGGRDHTTILGVIRKIEAKMNDGTKEGEEYKQRVEELWRNSETEFENLVRKENKQLNSMGSDVRGEGNDLIS